MNERARLVRAEWKSHRTFVLSAMAGLSFYTALPYALGTLIEPLEQDFGWGRTEMSAGLTIFAVLSMAGGLLIGATIDRLGARRASCAMPDCGISAFPFARLGAYPKFAQIQRPPGNRPAPVQDRPKKQ